VRRLLAELADDRTTGDVTTLGDPTSLATLRERLAAQRAAEPRSGASLELGGAGCARLDNTVREDRARPGPQRR
jgi:hypothetical protein